MPRRRRNRPCRSSSSRRNRSRPDRRPQAPQRCGAFLLRHGRAGAARRQALREEVDSGPHRRQLPAPRRQQQRGGHAAGRPLRQHARQLPGRQRRAAQLVRQRHDAKPRHGGAEQHGGFIHGHARHRGGFCTRALAPPQPPCAGGGTGQQTVVARQRGGRFRHAAPRQVVGRRHQHDVLDGKLALHQAGVRQRREVAAHRDIEAFLHQVDHAVGHLQLHVQARIGARQRRQVRRQVALRGGHRGGDPYRAAGLGHAPLHRLLRGLGFDQRGMRVIVEVAAGIGQRKAARTAVEQPRLQGLLQLGHALADRGLGHSQRPPRGGKTPMGHGDDEEAQVVEIDHHRQSLCVWTIGRIFAYYSRKVHASTVHLCPIGGP
ncbi:conserved hypothetical protein [Cupriavidus taiwanensis]|nr:conserved hypothetical protein [Cupriavidus taiwanensis]SOY84588.1 conserved hypothetical protein [Cupriavidus taiwanensis]